jgi:hypothetical protein
MCMLWDWRFETCGHGRERFPVQMNLLERVELRKPGLECAHIRVQRGGGGGAAVTRKRGVVARLHVPVRREGEVRISGGRERAEPGDAGLRLKAKRGGDELAQERGIRGPQLILAQLLQRPALL